MLLDVSLPTRLAHSSSYGKHHPISAKDGSGHGEGNCSKWLVRLHLLPVFMVAAGGAGLPRVEQKALVLGADHPVGEGGTAGEVVDANPDKSDCRKMRGWLIRGSCTLTAPQWTQDTWVKGTGAPGREGGRRRWSRGGGDSKPCHTPPC